MRIEDIPDNVLADVRQREFTDEQIEKMSAREVFDEYLKWNGIIGWADLFDTAVQLHEAEEYSSEVQDLDMRGFGNQIEIREPLRSDLSIDKVTESLNRDEEL